MICKLGGGGDINIETNIMRTIEEVEALGRTDNKIGRPTKRVVAVKEGEPFILFETAWWCAYYFECGGQHIRHLTHSNKEIEGYRIYWAECWEKENGVLLGGHKVELE